ncbi:MAG: putative hemolysin [Moraxellaceae bacterium]|jgi:putative hemolysin|nr:putative hemolysin [Moraxellaceae bacterium]
MDILIILLLILVNGVFAMSEIAIVSSRRVRLQQMADEGDLGARAALALAEHPTRFLSTVQIGITLIGILSGAFGEAAITQRLIPVFQGISLLAPYAKALATTCMVIMVTYVTLIIGEIVPKRIGMHSPEKIARLMAPVMRGLAWITKPLVTLLSASTDFLLRLLGAHRRDESPITEEEIKVLVAEGTEAGVFDKSEQDMIENVLRLEDWQLAQIMTPRADLVAIDLEDEDARQREVLATARHSYLPVCRGSISEVVGVVALHDLLAQKMRGETLDIQGVMHEPVFVPLSISPLSLLETFKRRREHLALVVDEYGSVQGLVALQDVMEPLVGQLEAADESLAEDPDIVQREDGSWLLDGSLPMERFKLLFPAETDELEEGGRDFQTLAGFVLFLRGHVPETGEHFEWNGLRIEVVDMDRRRIDKLLVKRLDADVYIDR